MTVPGVTEAALEQRLRRQAKQQGFVLRKSRVRNPNVDDWGGYRIVDADRNVVVCGSRFELNLDDVQAGEYPDDDRNANSAAALHEFAGYVRTLPDSDPYLRRLEALGDVVAAGKDVLSPGENASRAMSRVGFDNGRILVPRVSLVEFVEAAEQDAREWRDEQRGKLRGL